MKKLQKVSPLFIRHLRVTFTLWGEGASLALIDHPSSDGVPIKILYGVDVSLHHPSLHPVFWYWVG